MTRLRIPRPHPPGRRTAGSTAVLAVLVAVSTLSGAAQAATPPPPADPAAAAPTTTPAPAPEVREPAPAVAPSAQTVEVGGTATFTAAISPPVADGSQVRWQSAPTPAGPWADLGRTGTTLTVTVGPGMDGHVFRAVAAGPGGDSPSDPASLSVPPVAEPAPTTPAATSAATTPPAVPATPSADARPPSTPAPTPSPAEPTAALGGPAPAPTSSPAAPGAVPLPGAAPFGTVALATIRPADRQTATVHNLAPDSLVRASLLPSGVDLGTHRVGPDGSATTTFDMTGLAPGHHTVRWSPL